MIRSLLNNVSVLIKKGFDRWTIISSLGGYTIVGADGESILLKVSGNVSDIIDEDYETDEDIF